MILGAFTTLRKASVSFVISVHPAPWSNSQWTVFSV